MVNEHDGNKVKPGINLADLISGQNLADAQPVVDLSAGLQNTSPANDTTAYEVSGSPQVPYEDAVSEQALTDSSPDEVDLVAPSNSVEGSAEVDLSGSESATSEVPDEAVVDTTVGAVETDTTAGDDSTTPPIEQKLDEGRNTAFDAKPEKVVDYRTFGQRFIGLVLGIAALGVALVSVALTLVYLQKPLEFLVVRDYQFNVGLSIWRDVSAWLGLPYVSNWEIPSAGIVYDGSVNLGLAGGYAVAYWSVVATAFMSGFSDIFLNTSKRWSPIRWVGFLLQLVGVVVMVSVIAAVAAMLSYLPYALLVFPVAYVFITAYRLFKRGSLKVIKDDSVAAFTDSKKEQVSSSTSAGGVKIA
jgi:hypothetical protein